MKPRVPELKVHTHDMSFNMRDVLPGDAVIFSRTGSSLIVAILSGSGEQCSRVSKDRDGVSRWFYRRLSVED